MRSWLPLMMVGMTALVLRAQTVALVEPPAPEREAAAGRIEREEVGRPALADRRIVKHFDFNEEPLGNFEPIPMAWRPHAGVGFPVYLTNTPEGAFDQEVGAISGPPSFVLRLNGGSLAYHYAQRIDNKGMDIAVRTGSDYLVVAYVRTESLRAARTYMTAFLMDRQGKVLPDTEHRSRMIGGGGDVTEWQPITIALRNTDPEARYMGLSVWLVQPDVWNDAPRPLHAIEREDIRAVAWYDDITVYRLPRVSLRCPHPGHMFEGDEPITLETQVTDPDGLNLNATLHLEAEDGRYRASRNVTITRSDHGQGFQRHHFANLDTGLYRAELIVRAGRTRLLTRELSFIRLNEAISAPAESGQGFGVILRDTSQQAYAGQADLIRRLQLEYVKLPVWQAQKAATKQRDPQAALDKHLKTITLSQSIPVAILTDDLNTTHRPDGARMRSMMDILSDDPYGWKPLIAGTWSRFAGLVHVWQLGMDGDARVIGDERVPQVLATLREEMKSIMEKPRLAAVESWVHQPEITEDVVHAMSVPSTIAPDDFHRYLRSFSDLPLKQMWLTVEPLEQARYPRVERLADFSRRLAEAAFLGARGVFVESPWDVEKGRLREQVNPSEDLVIFRTLSDVLGGAEPVARTNILGKAQCLVFDRNGRAVLFVWDPYAPPEGREHRLVLGDRAEEVDLWGRRRPLESQGRRQVVRIGPVPKFIINTPTWLTEFRRHFQLDTTTVEASFDVKRYAIRFMNTYDEPITGTLRLVAPKDWDIRPNRMTFTLAEGEVFEEPIDIRFPVNAEAGVTAILGEFAIDADQRFNILTPAWFELGLENIDLETTVFRVDDRIVIRQQLTNRTGGPVSFQGSLVVPKRPRIRRTFVSFEQGQTVTKDFVISDAEELRGRKVRVSLRELRGDRLWNRIVTLP